MNESILFLLPVLMFSIVVHEVAHGYVADMWGDPTAKMLGRLTLNPIPHIDPIGSIVVPLLLWVSGASILFGWAKPVPVTTENLRDRKWGDIAVSLAGPGSNIALAIIFAVVLLAVRVVAGQPSEAVFAIAGYGILINVVLAVFNMIPVPPLDGSHVVAQFLPRSLAYQYRSLGRFGLLIIFLLLMVPGIRQAIFLPAFSVSMAMIRFALGGA